MHSSNFHFYNHKNHLYSKPVKGLKGFGVSYRFAFNGKERDNETYGEGNAYDFGARIYDSRLGRWLALDPLMKKYPNLNPFNFCANNPIFYIDPDGKKIIIPNVADREPILKMINTTARGVYGIRDNGELYVIDKNGLKDHSEYYRDRLIQAIDKTDGDINISIGKTIDLPIKNTKGETVGYTPRDLNAKGIGGGATQGDEGKDQKVTINGLDYNSPGSKAKNEAKDNNCNPLPQSAADILMHELVGHAIPKVLGESKGKNAVIEENKVRKQLGPGRNTQREVLPDHPVNNKVR